MLRGVGSDEPDEPEVTDRESALETGKLCWEGWGRMGRQLCLEGVGPDEPEEPVGEAALERRRLCLGS